MAASLWHRLGCCLTGHDYSVASDETRMFVRCKSCGHTSRGLPLHRDPLRHRQGQARAADASRGSRRSRLATP
jgi:hypothetical protein